MNNAVSATRLTYIHVDHLNTPRAMTDSTQTVVWRWDSDAFGFVPPNNDPDGNLQADNLALRFPGQLLDADNGLSINGFREYDPSLGRYALQSDPIGLEGGSWSTFGYVGGDPVGSFDSLGLFVSSCNSSPQAAVICGDAAASAAANVAGAAATAAAASAVQEKQCKDDCGPLTRNMAMGAAYAWAGIPLGGGSECDPLPWSDYNNKGPNYAQVRGQGSKCMGYRGSGKSKVEDHPDGHDDDNQAHHNCPHFHATNAQGEKRIFTYQRGT